MNNPDLNQNIIGIEFEKKHFGYYVSIPFLHSVAFWIRLKKSFWLVTRKRLPPINSMFVDGFGLLTRKVKEGHGSWKALEVIYNFAGYRSGIKSKTQLFLDNYYINVANCKSVRNRLKLSKQILGNLISEQGNNSQIRILSLACGSAQALIETIAENDDKNIKALLVDIDPEALEYAANLAQKHGVLGKVETMQRNAMLVAKITKDFKPNIVEMLGLLDYIPDSNATSLIKRIKDGLSDNGIFLTCNIHNNLERFFVKWAIDWDMIYRKPKELCCLIRGGGGFDNVQLYTEPLGIHSIVVARKN